MDKKRIALLEKRGGKCCFLETLRCFIWFVGSRNWEVQGKTWGFSFTVKDKPLNGLLQLSLKGEECEEFEGGIVISKSFSQFKKSQVHNMKNYDF